MMDRWKLDRFGNMRLDDDGDYIFYADHLAEIGRAIGEFIANDKTELSKKDMEIATLQKKGADYDRWVSAIQKYNTWKDENEKLQTRIKELEKSIG